MTRTVDKSSALKEIADCCDQFDAVTLRGKVDKGTFQVSNETINR